MNTNQLLGILVFIAGAVLFGFGIYSMQSVTEEVIEGVSGRYIEHNIWYIVIGIAMLIAGGALTFLSRNKE